MTFLKLAPQGYSGTISDGPVARRAALASAYESIHGFTLEAVWYMSGDWDMVVIFQGENHATHLASQWATLGAGSIERMKTVPVFSPDEFQSAFEGMDLGRYSPPGAD